MVPGRVAAGRCSGPPCSVAGVCCGSCPTPPRWWGSSSSTRAPTCSESWGTPRSSLLLSRPPRAGSRAGRRHQGGALSGDKASEMLCGARHVGLLASAARKRHRKGRLNACPIWGVRQVPWTGRVEGRAQAGPAGMSGPWCSRPLGASPTAINPHRPLCVAVTASCVSIAPEGKQMFHREVKQPESSEV